MIACNVKQMSKEVSPVFSAGDIAKIRNFTRSKVGFRVCAPAPGRVNALLTRDHLWPSGCV